MFQHVPFPFATERFPDELGAVIQTTVLDGKEPAREVGHTADNSWFVGDGVNDPNLPGAAVAMHIRHVVDADPTIERLSRLPLGCIATRRDRNDAWVISRHEWADESED
jgi:hypothetical protein